MAIEYRFTWSASTNITFRGESDWQAWWGDDEMTASEVEDALYAGTTPEGLGEVLEYSGFEWSAETREASS